MSIQSWKMTKIALKGQMKLAGLLNKMDTNLQQVVEELMQVEANENVLLQEP